MMDVQTTLNTYSTLMEYIKHRHAVLVQVLTQPNTLPDWARAEMAQLQIRGICETFAIACLVAHGDLEGTQTRRMLDAYQADFIIKSLEKLHPHFYPRPSTQIVHEGRVVGWKPIKHGFLTKPELLKSYRDTGDFLHAADLRSVLTGKQKQFDGAGAMEWASKVIALLNHHHIYLADRPGEQPFGNDPDGTPIPRRQIVVVMHDASDGRPHAHMFESFIQESPEPEGR